MRELETKLLNSQKEVQTLQDTITALEKDKRNLRLEVDSLVRLAILQINLFLGLG